MELLNWTEHETGGLRGKHTLSPDQWPDSLWTFSMLGTVDTCCTHRSDKGQHILSSEDF